MADGQVSEPIYRMPIIKRGLLPEELKEGVTAKLKLMDSDGPIVRSSVEALGKHFCLKPTKNSGKLDQRHVSGREYADAGVIPNKVTSPKKAKDDTSGPQGQQGVRRYDEEIMEAYHAHQFELFLKLDRLQKFDRDISYNRHGFLFRDGTKMSGSDFCNALDAVTLTYITTLESDDVGDVDIKEFRGNLRTVFDCCVPILRGRHAGSLAAENDIMSVNGYKQWKEHTWSIISFGALVVTLDMVSKKFGENSFLDKLE